MWQAIARRRDSFRPARSASARWRCCAPATSAARCGCKQTDGERVGPFLVIDCARRQDVAPLVARGWVVDVSYELGQAWAMNRPLAGVTVLEDPADATVGPVRLGVPTPFFVPAGEVVISAPTATPAETAAAPTPWPTRIPAGMAPPRRDRRTDRDSRAADPAPAPAADADRDDAYP